MKNVSLKKSLGLELNFLLMQECYKIKLTYCTIYFMVAHT